MNLSLFISLYRTVFHFIRHHQWTTLSPLNFSELGEWWQMNTASLFSRKAANTRPHIRQCISVLLPQRQGSTGTLHPARALQPGKLHSQWRNWPNYSEECSKLGPERQCGARNPGALSYCHQILFCPDSTQSLPCLFVFLPWANSCFPSIFAALTFLILTSTWNPTKPSTERARQHVVWWQVWYRKWEGACARGKYDKEITVVILLCPIICCDEKLDQQKSWLIVSVYPSHYRMFDGSFVFPIVMHFVFLFGIWALDWVERKATGTFSCHWYG